MIQSLDYLQGLIDGVYLSFPELIEPEKAFLYDVQQNENEFEIYISWISHYTPAKFQGDNLQPPDESDNNYYTQRYYVSKKENPLKVVKDFLNELEIAYEADLPELR